MAKEFCFGTEEKKARGLCFWKRDSKMAHLRIEVVVQSSLKDTARFLALFMLSVPCVAYSEYTGGPMREQQTARDRAVAQADFWTGTQARS